MPGGTNGFPNPIPNQMIFVTAKYSDIDWSVMTAPTGFVPPSTEAQETTRIYIPIYLHNDSIPTTINANLNIQNIADSDVEEVILWENNVLVWSNEPVIEPFPSYYTIYLTVNPKPDSGITIRVNPTIPSSLPSNRFRIVNGANNSNFNSPSASVINLTPSNNYKTAVTLQALPLSGFQFEAVGLVTFTTQIATNNDYNNLQDSVLVKIYDFGERIDRIPAPQLPPSEDDVFSTNGYYPLYQTQEAALRASQDAGNYPGSVITIYPSQHLIDANGEYEYYMPTGTGIQNYLGNYSTQSINTNTFSVTVTGGKYYMNSNGPAPTLTLNRGTTYTFNQTDNTNTNHPLLISTTSNGIHGGGTPYTSGFSSNGTAGSNLISSFTVPTNAPNTLYYYCGYHSNMGGILNIRPILPPLDDSNNNDNDLSESKDNEIIQ